MKKYYSIALLLVGFCVSGVAQVVQYANDWYKANPNATYIKLLVEEDGIYRVSSSDLTSAGYNISGVNPENMRLIYRGKEVKRYITKNASGELNYLEFYGKRNNGSVDSLMYRDPISGLHRSNNQPDKDISLFTDVSAYYLTWDGISFGQQYFSFSDVGYSLVPAETSFTYESKLEADPDNSNQSVYVIAGGGAYDSFHALNTDFVTGEGYLIKAGFSFGKPFTYSIPTPAPANTGQVTFKSRVFGRSNTSHHLRIEVNGNTSNPLIDTVLSSSSIYLKTYVRTRGETLSNSTDLRFYALQANTDNNNLAWASVTYERNFDMAGATSIKIKDWQKSSNSHFRFINADGQDSVFVYDLTDGVRSKGLMTGSGVAQTIVPFFNSPGNRQLFLTTDKGIKKPVIEAAALNTLHDPTKGAEFVIITHRSLAASAQDYEQYRDTCTVNPMTARVVYTDQIYDEYSFGSVSPWAIKRFCKEAMDRWNVRPRFFLLWGKGSHIVRNSTVNKVPTFGYPASDFEFIGHNDFNSTALGLKDAASIGRVNVNNNDQGRDYLAKVNEYEHTPYSPWMKNGVFLGGGANAGEQNAIQNGFEYYISRFSGKPYGGNPTYFQKNSNLTVLENSDYNEVISTGATIIHFFGHSSSNLNDIAIEEAFEYDNFGRYPLVIAMGCFGGDFTGRESFGERWVTEPKRGAIGYLANTSAGYLNPLRDYARIYYGRQFQAELGGHLGDVVRNTLVKYVDSLSGIQYRNHGRQMNLQADPAIKLYYPEFPDLAISQTSLYFTPDNFSAQDESFTLNLIVDNFGLAPVTCDSFAVQIRQRLPGGEVYNHPDNVFPMVRFRDTLPIKLFNPVGSRMAGQNIFEIFVDSKDSIQEYLETNNRISITRIVPGNIPATIYPPEYAIVADNRIHLDASAFFMTRDADVKYLFEIDTTFDFNSSFLQSSPVIIGTAAYATWEIPFNLVDSTVYYWRVRLVDARPSIWGTSSFKYIDTRTGWAQSQSPQFSKDQTEDISIDILQDEWKFDPFILNFRFEMADEFKFFYGGDLVSKFLSGYGNRILYGVIDQNTLEMTHRVVPIFGYLQNIENPPVDIYKLKNAINNADYGDYFFMAALGDTGSTLPNPAAWGDDVMDALDLIGATGVRGLPRGNRFMILGRKGFPGSAIELYSPNIISSQNASDQKYVIDQNLAATRISGKITSTLIGPSNEWKNMFWGWSSKDNIVRETATVDVYGVRNDNSDSLLLINVTPVGQVDLSTIPVNEFPYLKLVAAVADTFDYTAPQLENWHVIFDPVPDAVVDPVTNFVFQSDSLQEGQDVYIKMGARNISDFPMDSLKIKFTVVREDRTRLVLDSLRVAPLPAGNRVEFEYSFNTLGKRLGGNSNLNVEINPDFDQPEQYLFNNVYVQPFHVQVDDINPLMDVTFDGKHIMDGDIISPTPEIRIEVNDENPFIAIEDSQSFEIFFKEDSPIIPWEKLEVNSSEPRLVFSPAQLPENKARVEFYPGMNQPLPDGEYRLRVQGKDQKGNASGANDNFYEITFKVVNEATITHVLNYPNPFSTSTRFVYTLTGAEMPQKFQLHIYTISGKIVKVIDLLEMGEVNIGRNITSYAWDGTDEYGDRLANGVYLYRVVTEMPGDDLKLNQEGTEQYFKNGWGKMYLMR